MKAVKTLICLFLVLGPEWSYEWSIQTTPSEDGFGKPRTKRPAKSTTTTTPTPLTESIESEETTEWTTESTTSTTIKLPPKPKCPPGENTYVKDDLANIIATRTSHVVDTVTGNFIKEATNMREKHTNNLRLFLKWFSNRPEHLKHILEDISKSRSKIQLAIDDVHKEIELYPQIAQEYNQTVERVKKLHNSIDRLTQFCNIACEANGYTALKTSADTIDDGHYCAKDKDLNDKITITIDKFIENVTDEYKQKIVVDDNAFIDKVEALKNRLKDIALNTFGRTMYDILNLIDEYHHLEEEVLEVPVKDKLDFIANTLHDCKAKLYYVERNAKQIERKCRACKVSHLGIHDYIVGDTLEQRSDILLQDLLIEKQNLDQRDIDSKYLDIFKQLNQEVDVENAERYVVDLKLIEDQVNSITAAEFAKYSEIMDSYPREAIQEIKRLKSATAAMPMVLQDFERDLGELDAKYCKDVEST